MTNTERKAPPIRILFLCVANSARSQIAEGLAKKLFGSYAIIQSAGSKPSGVVHPSGIAALSEVGIDIGAQKSKAIDALPSDFLDALDIVVTLCAEEICPVMPSSAQRLHWPLPDPAGISESEQMEVFRSTKDDIRARLIGLAAKLQIPIKG
jgi:arsenate reductase